VRCLRFGLGHDDGRRLRADRMPGYVLITLQTLLQPLDHAILRDRDDGRCARLEAFPDAFEVGVLEALVADLAPDPAACRADRRCGDNAGREDQTDESARDGTALRPLLTARIRGLLEGHFAVCLPYDDGRVDEVHRPFAVHGSEILERGTRFLFGGERCDEHLNRVIGHVCASFSHDASPAVLGPPSTLLGPATLGAVSPAAGHPSGVIWNARVGPLPLREVREGTDPPGALARQGPARPAPARAAPHRRPPRPEPLRPAPPGGADRAGVDGSVPAPRCLPAPPPPGSAR